MSSPLVIESEDQAPIWQDDAKAIGGGCLWMVGVVAISCGLLFVDAIFCVALFYGIAPLVPRWFQGPRMAQTLFFLGPCLLLFLQWYLFDILREIVRRRLFSSRRRTVQSTSKAMPNRIVATSKNIS